MSKMQIAQEKLTPNIFPTCAVNIEETCRISVQLTALITVVLILMYRTTDSHQTQKTCAMWVKKVNRTDIVKYAFLRSNHFTEDCFDKSYEN